MHRASDTAYPTCPGVIAGSFDETVYTFKNYGPDEILFDLKRVRSLLQRRNPKMRFLFTVSPVPLTATASGKHVLVATTYSKSTLRSVCGAMTDRFPDVDYFPSYELIASPFSRGFFFEPNMRSVTTGGVNSVMRVFFSEHRFAPAKPATAMPGPRPPQERPINDNDDLVCEERLLEAFQR